MIAAAVGALIISACANGDDSGLNAADAATTTASDARNTAPSGPREPDVRCEPSGEPAAAANTDETLVPDYELPDPLVTDAGDTVGKAADWVDRRAEIAGYFETDVFGMTPDGDPEVVVEVLGTDEEALDGTAVRTEVAISVADGPTITLLLYTPVGQESSPVFLVPNFLGNHTIHPDPGITITESWLDRHPGEDPARGERSRRYPVEMILERGYGLATWWYEDVQPDEPDGFGNGIHPLFYEDGQTEPYPDEWGAIGAWAWGNSRVLDYLETDAHIQGDSVAVGGHSRLGKVALWSGAQDDRFALVFANDSGSSGAAISRRQFGETVAIMNGLFPHWMAANYRCYNDAESELPIDQHELIALMAPRPVYVASAAEDLWADPTGEFLGVRGADAVYQLLGLDGLPVDEQPPVDTPVLDGTLGYHIRTGDHDLTSYDWEQALTFADQHIG